MLSTLVLVVVQSDTIIQIMISQEAPPIKANQKYSRTRIGASLSRFSLVVAPLPYRATFFLFFLRFLAAVTMRYTDGGSARNILHTCTGQESCHYCHR